MMSIVAIVNPISGTGANMSVARQRIALVRDAAARRGLSANIHVTERAGHARELAAQSVSAGADLVIVWGGDGTVNEAGTSLIGSPTTLGLVPAGSGNGLAAALGTPFDPHAALAAAFDGETRTIDAGLLAGKPFFNIAGIGFDARVARLFNARGAGRRGKWPYIAIGVREGCRYDGVDYKIALDAERFHVRALLVAFANGREYGMGARIAPQAELDDGLIDATIVAQRPLLSRFWDARRLAAGTAHLAPGVTVRRVRHAMIEADDAIEFHRDGEPGVIEGKVEVRIVPAALRVRVAKR